MAKTIKPQSAAANKTKDYKIITEEVNAGQTPNSFSKNQRWSASNMPPLHPTVQQEQSILT